MIILDMFDFMFKVLLMWRVMSRVVDRLIRNTVYDGRSRFFVCGDFYFAT